MANIQGSPLAVGGYSPTTNKAETYNISSKTWNEVADYPYHDQLVYISATVSATLKFISVFVYLQQSQQNRGPLSLVVTMMLPMWPQLLATTRDGAD